MDNLWAWLRAGREATLATNPVGGPADHPAQARHDHPASGEGEIC